MPDFFLPVKFAWRALASRPAFTAIVVVCLTLGIAVNTTIFAVFDGILWRPYDFHDPESIVALESTQPKTGNQAGLSLLTLRDVQSGARSLREVAGLVDRSLTITDGDEPERLLGASITWNLFPMLGKTPQLGRGFRADEDAGAPPAVVLLGDALWRRRYNSDSSIVDRTIHVNGSPYTVVGVMPPRFRFPETADLWIPMGDFGRLDTREQRNVMAFARLRDGVGMNEAGREFASLVTRIERDAGLSDQGWTGRVISLRDQFIPQDIRVLTITMLGAVTFVLLIACANVANLLLARATSRARELALRAALGAGRAAIVRQLLLEGVLMALVAAVLSVPVAQWGLRLIDRGIPSGDPVPYFISWQIDARVLLYTVGVSLAAAVTFALLPALQATSGRLHAALQEGGRGSGAGRGRNRTRSVLVVAEVALALVLLIGASLFVRSFATLKNEGVGFDTAPIMTMRTFLLGTPYDSAFARQQRIEDLVRRVGALPGVEAATASNLIPLDGGGSWSRIAVQGREYREEDAPFIWWSGVTSGWSRTLGLTLLQGRDLTEAEVASRTAVAVIDDRVAAGQWPGVDPIGRQFRMAADSTLPWFTVVGVVRHYRQGQQGDRDEDPGSVYVPLSYSVPRNVGLMARVTGDPGLFTNAMREQIRGADAMLPVFDVNAMEQVRALGYWQYGLFGWMFGVFGAVALLLAAIGVYGVMAYSVSQRTREFGVRLALGAQRHGVLTMVVRHGLTLAGIGVGVGLLGALGVTNVLRSILVVSPTDPISFISVSLFLLVVALVACYFPARRATAVDPIIALRAE